MKSRMLARSPWLLARLRSPCRPVASRPTSSTPSTTRAPATTDVRGINELRARIAGYASLDGVTNFSFTYAGGVFTIAAGASRAALRARHQRRGRRRGDHRHDAAAGDSSTRRRLLHVLLAPELDPHGSARRSTTRPARRRLVLRTRTRPASPRAPDSSTTRSTPCLHRHPRSRLHFHDRAGHERRGQVVGQRAAGERRARLPAPARRRDHPLHDRHGSPRGRAASTTSGLITGFVTWAPRLHGFVGDSLGYELLDRAGRPRAPSAKGSTTRAR